MSLKPTVLAALCISSTLIFAGCSKSPDSDEKTPAAEASKRAPSGEALLTLDRAAQQRMGLTIEPLASAQFQPEWKAQGRVIDPAALGAMAVAVTEARAASEASQSELVRVQALAVSSNASERALQAAKATAARDAAQLESARVKLLGEWGAAIADRPDLPGLIQSLISMQSSLIRADLPLGQTISSTPSHVRIAALSDETNFIEAEFVGPAPAVLSRMEPHSEPRYVAAAKVFHRKQLERLAQWPRLVFGIALLLFLLALGALPFLGSEFLPDFREGHFVVQASMAPGTSLPEMLRVGARISDALLKNPAIQSVELQAGRAEQGEDTWG
ncbi:MAG TPA: efflux RND transporter permease subunit, partial [Verrucomicrobiae bacterium]|nr:efflux RND transporter permease subunit [Verrucomicrobiae bacterium]